MSKTANRKNNCIVYFMINEEDMNGLNRRVALTNFKNKREFYRDSIFKNRIISIDISGAFRKELREFSSLLSRNSANLNQIAKMVNSTGGIYKDDIKSIKNLCKRSYFFYQNSEKKFPTILLMK